MPEKTVLPDSISRFDDIKDLDLMAADSISKLDLSPLIMYLIDYAPVEALPALAAQFNVLGYKGWKFATTDTQRRALIKNAIEIHRYKGTPWSIKEALKTIGITGTITITEGIYHFYDGNSLHNGGITYGGNGWAAFRVSIDINNLVNFNLTDVEKIILEYKNARSWLEDVSLLIEFVELLPPTESNTFGIFNHTEVLGQGIIYNSAGKYNGAYLHDYGENDTLNITVLPYP